MKKTGDEYFDSEEFRNLLDGYEESVKSGHPVFMDADDLADIADYYHFMGANQDADETIDYALSLYPNATLPNVFRAREALTAGDIDKAKECVEQIENKEDPEYQYMQAELLIAQDKVEEADQFLREYFSTIPPDEYQDFVMDVSNIYNDYGLNDKAYEWMMRTKGDDSNDFKELMARTLFGLGKYKDSERIFNELLDKNPYSTRYWNALASAQFMNEDISNAITSSEYAIAIDPKNPEGLLSKANGLYQLGNYDEAILYYNRYLEVAQPDDIVPQIYQELALCHSSLHHLDEALAYINKIQGSNSDPTDMLVMKGHILEDNKEDLGFARTVVIACAVALTVGAYDGFYGPGSGTFMLLLLAGAAHMKIQEANATAKVINLCTCISSLAVYLINGQVLIILGLAAGLTSTIGAWIGTKMFDRDGSGIVKPIIILVISIFFIKIIIELIS